MCLQKTGASKEFPTIATCTFFSHLCIFICVSNVQALVKSSPQYPHVHFFLIYAFLYVSPMYKRWYRVRHNSHMYIFFSFMHFYMCLQCTSAGKEFATISTCTFFSHLCIFICVSNVQALVKSSPQYPHVHFFLIYAFLYVSPMNKRWYRVRHNSHIHMVFLLYGQYYGCSGLIHI